MDSIYTGLIYYAARIESEGPKIEATGESGINFIWGLA